MLVWVASYPRSGNHLTMQTLREAFGINRFGTGHGNKVWMGSMNAGYEIPPELEDLGKEELLDALRDRPEPFFIKTHRPEHAEDPAPALNIVRDGRDVHVSQAHWRIEKNPEEPFNDALEALISRRAWSKHVERWRNRTAPTALIRFEDLVEDPVSLLKHHCDAIGVPLPEASGRVRPFEALQKRNPKVYRKGKAGAWREEMPAETEARFWEIHSEAMQVLGYEREKEQVA